MKTLTCGDILILEQILPGGRKGIKKRRINLDLSRDLQAICREAEAIRDTLGNLKPQELVELENSFRMKCVVESQSAKSLGLTVNPMEVELKVRYEFDGFEKMQSLQKKYLKEERKYLNEPSSVELITQLKEEDIPEDCDPETTDALIYFLE